MLFPVERSGGGRSSNDSFQAGGLAAFKSHWLGAPQNVIRTIMGYRIPFLNAPPITKLSRSNVHRFQTKSSPEMSAQIQKLLDSRAAQKTSFQSGFLSTMFLRKKSNGENRPILNLSRLNDFVSTPPFRLINQQQIPGHLKNGDYMMKIDISQAYFHIPIEKNHRRFLCFAYQDNVYEMTCLPFGLASAPAAFAKVTNWIAQQLRQENLRVLVYLDDFLIIHEDPMILEEQARFAKNFLQTLGWQVNLKKSSEKATTKLEYLGISWDTRANTKSLPRTKSCGIKSHIAELVQKKRWSWQDAKVILGKLNFAALAVPLGRLHCRTLQRISKGLPHRSPHRKLPILDPALEELNWWLDNVHRKSPIHFENPTIFISTDAALLGWGAIANSRYFWGKWTISQRKWHSNMKELWTVLEVLKRLESDLRGKTAMIQSDNRTTVAYINKQGGTRSLKLLDAAKQILLFCQRHHCHLIARYIPGPYNGIADGLSRDKALPEWHLKKGAVSNIFKLFGEPEIDLFASKRSAVVPAYVSERAEDKHSQFIDAFSRAWKYNLAWIFPPPALIPRILHHLQSSEGRYILIAPVWPNAFWEPDLKRRATRPAHLIPNLQENLIDLQTNHPPPQVEQLKLAAWLVQGGQPR